MSIIVFVLIQILLKKVIESVDSIELLERLLERLTESQLNQRQEQLDRLAMEFNKLRHNVSTVTDIPLMNQLEPVSLLYYQVRHCCGSLVVTNERQ